MCLFVTLSLFVRIIRYFVIDEHVIIVLRLQIVKILIETHLFLDDLSKLHSWNLQSRFCLCEKLFSKFMISELELLTKHENDEVYGNTSDFT
jgi:hypothetical protein